MSLGVCDLTRTRKERMGAGKEEADRRGTDPRWSHSSTENDVQVGFSQSHTSAAPLWL